MSEVPKIPPLSPEFEEILKQAREDVEAGKSLPRLGGKDVDESGAQMTGAGELGVEEEVETEEGDVVRKGKTVRMVGKDFHIEGEKVYLLLYNKNGEVRDRRLLTHGAKIFNDPDRSYFANPARKRWAGEWYWDSNLRKFVREHPSEVRSTDVVKSTSADSSFVIGQKPGESDEEYERRLLAERERLTNVGNSAADVDSDEKVVGREKKKASKKKTPPTRQPDEGPERSRTILEKGEVRKEKFDTALDAYPSDLAKKLDLSTAELATIREYQGAEAVRRMMAEPKEAGLHTLTPEEIQEREKRTHWENRSWVRKKWDTFMGKQPPPISDIVKHKTHLASIDSAQTTMSEEIARLTRKLDEEQGKLDSLNKERSETARRLQEAIAARQGAVESDAKAVGAMGAIKALDANMKKYLPTWARLAIGGTIVGASLLTGAYAPALAGYIFATACAWRAASAVTAAAAITTLTHGHFEKKGWRGGSVAALTAGLGAGAGSFLLGPMLAQWLGIAGPGISGSRPTPGASAALANSFPPGSSPPSGAASAIAGTQPPGSRVVPPPNRFPAWGEVPRGRVGFYPDWYRAPMNVPITPSVARYGVDGLANVHFFGRCGLFETAGFSSGAKEQFKDVLRRTLVENPEYAKRLLGYSGDPRDLVRGRDILFPDRGKLNMRLFSHPDFMRDLHANIISHERKFLLPELGGKDGVRQFIMRMAHPYGR